MGGALTFAEYCEKFEFDISDKESIQKYQDYISNVKENKSLYEMQREGDLPKEIFD